MLDKRLRRWDNINPFSAGNDFRRQILTYKVDPRTERNTSLQMKRKELNYVHRLELQFFF